MMVSKMQYNSAFNQKTMQFQIIFDLTHCDFIHITVKQRDDPLSIIESKYLLLNMK